MCSVARGSWRRAAAAGPRRANLSSEQRAQQGRVCEARQERPPFEQRHREPTAPLSGGQQRGAWGRRRTTALRPVEASSGSLGAAQALAAAVARSGACARWACRWVPRAALRSLEDARPAGKRSGAAARPMQPAVPVRRAGSGRQRGSAAAGHAAGAVGARRAVRRARRGAGRAAGSGLLSVADRRVPGRPSSPAVSSSCPPAERLGVAAPWRAEAQCRRPRRAPVLQSAPLVAERSALPL